MPVFAPNPAWAQLQPGTQLPAAPRIYRPVGDFTLQDASGKEINRETMLGHIWVAHFFLISCRGPCPAITAHIAGLLQKFPAKLNVQALGITVDPEHDTPERLREHAERLGADVRRWHFARTDAPAVRTVLTTAFRIPAADDPQAHSTNLVLVDAAGKIRGYYSGLRSEDIARLADDVRYLLNERAPEKQNQ